jgi:aconitate hydratase
MAPPAASSRSTTIRSLSHRHRPSAALVALVAAYAKAQGMYRTKSTLDPMFTDVLKLELAQVEPSLAGPKRRRTASRSRR